MIHLQKEQAYMQGWEEGRKALREELPSAQPDHIADDERKIADLHKMVNYLLSQLEQRWIPCGKCIHADGKHRWCKVLDRTINEDYFCYWAEPFREEGEANDSI